MRAPVNEPKEYKSIGLPVRLWDFVKYVGNGQYAHGIRYVIEQAYLQENKLFAEVDRPEMDNFKK